MQLVQKKCSLRSKRLPVLEKTVVSRTSLSLMTFSAHLFRLPIRCPTEIPLILKLYAQRSISGYIMYMPLLRVKHNQSDSRALASQSLIAFTITYLDAI